MQPEHKMDLQALMTDPVVQNAILPDPDSIRAYGDADLTGFSSNTYHPQARIFWAGTMYQNHTWS